MRRRSLVVCITCFAIAMLHSLAVAIAFICDVRIPGILILKLQLASLMLLLFGVVAGAVLYAIELHEERKPSQSDEERMT